MLFQCKKGSIPSWSSIIAQHAHGPVWNKEVTVPGRALSGLCAELVASSPHSLSGSLDSSAGKDNLNPLLLTGLPSNTITSSLIEWKIEPDSPRGQGKSSQHCLSLAATQFVLGISVPGPLQCEAQPSGLKLQAEWSGYVNKAEHHQWIACVSLSPRHIRSSPVGSCPGPVRVSGSVLRS